MIRKQTPTKFESLPYSTTRYKIKQKGDMKKQKVDFGSSP